jgi:tetratricopeptide (TPR) repeat protein
MILWKHHSKENNIMNKKINHLRQQIPLLSKERRYKEIIDILHQIRYIVKESVGENDLEYAQTIYDLASVYTNLLYEKRIKGDYSEAEVLYKQVLNIRLNLIGEDHPDYAVCLHDLAWMYYCKGEYDNAERLYIKAYDIYRRIFKEDDQRFAGILITCNQAYGYDCEKLHVVDCKSNGMTVIAMFS